MPKVLEAEQIDQEQAQVDEQLTAAEEQQLSVALSPLAPGVTAPDLSDGGQAGGAMLYPTQGGVKQDKGRATVRRAWMWDGTESMLPLAWNPDGTQHDNARRYLLKRHCLCCNTGGFRARPGQRAQCPNCVKNNCMVCHSSTDPSKIIASFYLTMEAVPFPKNVYGQIDCFLPTCTRRVSNGAGFKTDQDMRMHARTRHKLEYESHMEGERASRTDEIEVLRQRLDAMTGTVLVSKEQEAVEEIQEREDDEVQLADKQKRAENRRQRREDRVPTGAKD